MVDCHVQSEHTRCANMPFVVIPYCVLQCDFFGYEFHSLDPLGDDSNES